MQRAIKPKKGKDDLTEEEIDDVMQFDIDKAKGKTKRCTLEELLKELHS